MTKRENNYAFIDGQNVNLGVQKLGWKMDWRQFRIYLRDKYHVSEAYYFIGFLAEHQQLYRALQRDGFILIFKPTMRLPDGRVKGNVDAELVLQAMIEYPKYDGAVIATSDGDFACLVDYLYTQGKLKAVLSTSQKEASSLLKKAGKEKARFLAGLEHRLALKK